AASWSIRSSSVPKPGNDGFSSSMLSSSHRVRPVRYSATSKPWAPSALARREIYDIQPLCSGVPRRCPRDPATPERDWRRTRVRYRVIQWATGTIGKRALAAALEHPELEVVGVRVYDPAKVGEDAGTLAGARPVGIAATDDVDALVALDADCVL